MEEKSKRIKLLEKKIESLKQSELVRKELGRDIDMADENVVVAGTLVSDDTFRDYESEHVPLLSRSWSTGREAGTSVATSS
jgi:hypothetical protein